MISSFNDIPEEARARAQAHAKSALKAKSQGDHDAAATHALQAVASLVLEIPQVSEMLEAFAAGDWKKADEAMIG